MRLDFIALDKLSVSKNNMRHGRRAPDVSDILPTVRKRGVIVPILVRPGGDPDGFEIDAGARRFHAALIVADERRAEGLDVEPMPCAILDDGDDAAAIEASLIENVARLDPDEVSRWEAFSRLVREGRDPEDIAQTFGLPDLAVKRILALGNLLPRIRDLYRAEKIDRTTVRHLTMASKSQQRAWLALLGDPAAHCPTGRSLKDWLFGGNSIPVKHALFDPEGMRGIVSDLFGDDAYFSDAEAFWAAQDTAIAAKREELLEAGWPDVVIVPRGEHFQSWHYEKAPKRKGGRVYIDVRESGEVTVHEGYVTSKEARRIEKGEPVGPATKAVRAEVTSTLDTYIDLHRHAAARAALLGHPQVALRLMLAHAMVGSQLWSVKTEPQATRNEQVRESIECAPAEALFDTRRREVLALLGASPEDETVARGGYGDPCRLACTFLRLMALGDAQVMQVLVVVMGETLAAGHVIVDAVGAEIGVDLRADWEADEAFYALLRDREVLLALVAEVAGQAVADANAKEKGTTLKAILRGHLEGTGGRSRVEGWVPRWMAFPPAAYTTRGSVGSVAAYAKLMAARAEVADCDAGEVDLTEAETQADEPIPPLAA